MNDLIDVSAGDFFHTHRDLADDPSGLLSFIPGADSSFAAGAAFGEGNWAGGLLNLANAGLAVAQTAIDPFGTLASSVAGFLLDYMPPLPQALDILAGNPALVESIGNTWMNVGERMKGLSADLQAAAQDVAGSWRGVAGDAYRTALMALAVAMEQAGTAYHMLGIGYGIASAVVEVVREITKNIIADLVGRLIVYVAETGATLGVALPIVIGQAVTAITKTVSDVTTFADTLIDAITLGGEHLGDLIDALSMLMDAVNQIVAGIEQGAGAVTNE